MLRSQVDRQPDDGRAPTSTWEPGDTVVESVHLPVPADLAPGPARVIVGLYRFPALRRLAASGPDGRSDHVSLATVTVARR